MISVLDREVFIGSVGKLRKDSGTELSCCCPACGETKNRLHLVNVPQDDYSYVKCWNQGCQLDEPTSVFNFLKIINSSYISLYKRKSFSKKIDEIKSERSLDGLLAIAKAAKEPVPVPLSPTNTLEKEIPKAILDTFHKAADIPDCVQYLKDRHIEVQPDWMFSTDKFFTFNGKSTYLLDFLIIPIYNRALKFKGWYSRSINEKRFGTFLLADGVKFWAQYPGRAPDIVCEGILDALSTGFSNSSAAISADIPLEVLQDLPLESIIAFDNDETGIRKSLEYAKLGYKIFVWPNLPEKDFNELLVNGNTKEQIKELILANVKQGVQAEVYLRMKEA